jgi:hypothetical protein
MRLLTLLKLKFAVGAALLSGGGVLVLAISQTSGHQELTAQEIVQQAQDSYDTLSSYSDSGAVTTEAGGVHTKIEFYIRLLRPNSYRVDWIQTTGGRYTGRGNVWSAGGENFVILATAGRRETYPPQKAHDMQTALAMGAGASGLASSTIPRIFYSQDYAETLGLRASDSQPFEKERDDRVDGVECYVVKSVTVTGKLGTAKTLWIGRRDHLIHQARTTLAGTTITETHENIDVNPVGLAAYFVP